MACVLANLLLLLCFTVLNGSYSTQSWNLENIKLNITNGNFYDSCNIIITKDRFIIQSPEFLTANSTCYYVFKGQPCPTYFNLRFLYFNLTRFDGCLGNRLEVINNEVLCGNVSGLRTYFANEGLLKVRLVVNNYYFNQGFKILITRLPCYDDPNFHNAAVINHSNTNSNYPFCCAKSYSAQIFFLSSPNFPYTTNILDECVYQIYKTSSKVCRLRIQFLFFSLGEQMSNNVCNRGYLELDGKYICGCRTGLKLISAFDLHSKNSFKLLRLKQGGFSHNEFGGFILQVIQDECPERIPSTLPESKLDFYNSNRIAWIESYDSIFKKAHLTHERKYFDKSNPSIVQHVYVFEDSEEKDNRDVEEVTLDSSDFTEQNNNNNSANICKPWWAEQMPFFSNEVLRREIAECNAITGKQSRQCVQANLVRGYIQSPEYPYYYPKDLHICFRFTAQNGYCGVRLYFTDFEIDKSYQCTKDYLLLGEQYRYCGTSLHKAGLTFDLKNRYEEIAFVTSGYTCGRGFKCIYEQIPCYMVNPVDTLIPINPTTPLPPTLPPTVYNKPCNRNIQDSSFVIEVYDYHQARCVFNIIKNNEHVCRIALRFDNINLLCENEHLLIGNRRYCGKLNTEILNIDFTGYHQLPLTYERLSTIPVLSSLRFRITGNQMMEDCDPIDFPNVEPERLRLPYKQELPDEFFKTFRSDICGLILNTKNDISSEICKILMDGNKDIECIPVTEQVIYMPYSTSKEDMRYLLKGANVTETINIREIPCEDSKIN